MVQNFRPGVLAKLGFGYEDFKRINPRIIYCSGSGYGDSGPYLDRPGQDMLIQGLTGLAAATGRGDGPPVPVGSGFSDQIGAMNMVYGILDALYWRERSGKGQEIQVDLMSGLLAHQGQEMLAALNFERGFRTAEFRHRPSRHGRALRRLSHVGRLGDDRYEPFQETRLRAR